MRMLSREGGRCGRKLSSFLVLAEMKEWVGGSRVVIKGRHHKLLREVERGDFPRQRRVGGSRPAVLHPFWKLLTRLIESLMD